MPSFHMLAVAGLSVMALYTLVPEGKLRNRLKWAVAVLVLAVALARLHLGVDLQRAIVVSVLIGVSFAVTGFRYFAPSEVFPVTYRRGRSAHLDVKSGATRRRDSQGGRRAARLHRHRDQTVRAERVGRVDAAALEGRTAQRRPTCSASSTRAPTCGRTAGTSWVASCCTDGWRTRSPSTRCVGWCNRRTTRCAWIRGRGVPGARSYGFVELTPEREYCWLTEFLKGAVELGEAVVDDAIHRRGASMSCGSCGTPASPIATSSRPTFMVHDGRIHPDRTSPSPSSGRHRGGRRSTWPT